MRIVSISLVLAGGLLLGCGGAPAKSGGGTGGAEEETGGSPGSEGGKGGSATGGKTGSGGSTGGSGPATGGTGGTTTEMPDGSAGGATGDAAAPIGDPGPPGAFPLCPKCKQIFDGKTLDGWEQSPAGSFVVKEAAIASTGAGAHAWTKEDYGDFRLFFQVKQISGNHKPCTTLFTTRPAPGKAPARGLAGIQFQPPLGGSWDYRPGKNSGPDGHWTYPMPRPVLDPKKWHRCEVLARASTGEWKAACCEIEGKDSCKGVEVVRYKDPTAGKKGPFALMMHNGGLFDLYKDFWIETDPVGDELVSTK
jgi:3-keto-disaccharide hydrolase